MAKTPISILHEHCAKLRIEPQYDLVVNEGSARDPFFKYKLTVCDIVIFGDGTSKKKAKQEVARQAINILIPFRKTVQQDSADRDSRTEVQAYDSICKDDVKQNFIGELATICISYNLPKPKYVFAGEIGLPHLKTFTFECHAAKLKVSASSRTKQQAKQQSARKMTDSLRPILASMPVESDESRNEKAEELFQKAQRVISKTNKKMTGGKYKSSYKDDQSFNTYLFFNNSPLLESLPVYSRDMSDNYSDPCKLLTELFHSCGKSVKFTFLPSKSKTCCSCIMDTAPYFVTVGMSNTKLYAQLKAAHMLIMLFKLFA